MTAIPIRDEERLLPAPSHPKEEVGWWGMAWFLATEATLFAYLLGSYFYLGVSNGQWPPAGVEDPKLQLPLIMTALLLASSVAAWLGERALKRDGHLGFRLGLGAAILLGLGFLALQAAEYRDKLQHMLPREHAYAAIFYTITGFHGAHVAMGILLLLYVGVRELLGHFDARDHLAVANVALYWHTVDAIWLAILASLYLSPRLYG